MKPVTQQEMKAYLMKHSKKYLVEMLLLSTQNSAEEKTEQTAKKKPADTNQSNNQNK